MPLKPIEMEFKAADMSLLIRYTYTGTVMTISIQATTWMLKVRSGILLTRM